MLPEYPSWRNYFDAVITGAAKPAFFSERRPLWLLGPGGERLGEAHVAGARAASTRAATSPTFERLMGIGGDRVLYVGDHIYGDILRSKKSSLWRTCMVVQELEARAGLAGAQPAIRWPSCRGWRLARADGGRDGGPPRVAQRPRSPAGAELRRRLPGGAGSRDAAAPRRELETLRRALRDADGRIAALERSVEEGLNPYWGLTFKEGNENSRFGEQVEDYACLYTSRVSNFVYYSPMQYFRSPRATMPHERAAPARISPWGDAHGAPRGGDRPSKASKAAR